eukprot:758619-Hanusia_phi.AAC.7
MEQALKLSRLCFSSATTINRQHYIPRRPSKGPLSAGTVKFFFEGLPQNCTLKRVVGVMTSTPQKPSRSTRAVRERWDRVGWYGSTIETKVDG